MDQHSGISTQLTPIILSFLLTAFSTSYAQTNPDTAAAGIWEGSLDVGRTKLRIVFHVTNMEDNALHASLDSPDQGATGIPVSKVTASNDSVVIEVAAANGSFRGRYSRGKTSIEGNWSQNGVVLPLTLRRVTTVSEVKRPQEPKPPFPYRAEDVSYENALSGVKLSGTLTLPTSGGPFPVALLITGSGPQDRDETLFGHKPFLVIADYLTKRGIAVLRVDDRGVGGSTGSMTNATTTDFATDVEAGISYLKSRHDIDPAGIGLIGHSEGGIIAPIIAARSQDVAYIVMLAGTGFAGDVVIEKQVQLIEEADGAPEAKIQGDVEHYRKLFSIIKSGKDSATIARNLRGYLKSTISIWGTESQNNGVDPNTSVEAQMKSLLAPWFTFFLTYDPKPTLEKILCPVLALGGSLDLQVAAKENLKVIEDALHKGGNRDHTVRLLPGLNHLFQHAKTGSPREYAQIEETFAPEVLNELGDWIEQHRRK